MKEFFCQVDDPRQSSYLAQRIVLFHFEDLFQCLPVREADKIWVLRYAVLAGKVFQLTKKGCRQVLRGEFMRAEDYQPLYTAARRDFWLSRVSDK